MNSWLHACERGADPREVATPLLPWFCTSALLADFDQLEMVLEEWVSNPYPASAQGIATQAAACLVHDASNPLSQILAPTLVLVGAEGIVTPLACSQELAAGIPNARLQVLERGSHIPDVEYPEAVSAALLAFLSAWPATRPTQVLAGDSPSLSQGFNARRFRPLP